MKLIPKDFFKADAVYVAKKLLGKVIEYKGISGMIVETEAYKTDMASHGYKITSRSEIMLRTYGHIYVYFIYGSYFCLNITTNENEVGAVLIRALEPLSGISAMQERRSTENIYKLTSGPGMLCKALNIDKSLNGIEVNEKIKVFEYKNFDENKIGFSPRIGIKKALDLDWRFFIKDNKFVSGIKQR